MPQTNGIVVALSCVNMKAPLKSAGGAVQKLVAFPAKRDQVGLCIVTKAAAPSQVVNIEILRASTSGTYSFVLRTF